MAFLEFNPRGNLYHYCPLGAFEAILSSKSLWMSDLGLTNDPRELNLGLSQILEAIQSVRHLEYSGDRGIFLSVLWAKIDGFHRNLRIFTTCFSPHGDELPMWREYASGSTGISIGFRNRAIKDMQGRLQRVNYVDEGDLSDFVDFVRSIAEVFSETKGLHDQSFWLEAVCSAYAKITSLKHRSWEYEREVRLCFSQVKYQYPEDEILPSVSSVASNGDLVFWEQPLTRRRGDVDIPYLSRPFGKLEEGLHSSRQAISEVVLGPLCDADEKTVSDMLHGYDFQNFTVRRSNCQIR